MYTKENYDRIRLHIDQIAKTCHRDAENILLLPVSKTFPSQTIQLAIDSGLHTFGENRIQEASQKIEQLTGDVSFHLIGHLQSNKAKQAVSMFDLIHSIDKISTAQKIAIEAHKQGKTQKILVQVNTSGEPSKNGTTPGDALKLCSEILELDNIALQGLMTIGPLTDETAQIRASFIMLRNLKNAITEELSIPLPHLSMGMSGDYKIAIEEGATIVRIGSAIFGTRHYPL